MFAARARTKAKEGVTDGWFAKFPKDVIYCEQLTNGNPNILNEEPFAEKKKEKLDYSLIFGDPEEIKAKRKEEIQREVNRKIRARQEDASISKSPAKTITHPRFLGHSDHTVRILAQPSTPYHVRPGAGEAEETEAKSSPAAYTCSLCQVTPTVLLSSHLLPIFGACVSKTLCKTFIRYPVCVDNLQSTLYMISTLHFPQFATGRVNVMLMHSKSHSAPDRTSLANFARSRSDSEPRTKAEAKGSRLFAEAKASMAKKRKLVYSSPKVASEPGTKKTKVNKKQKKEEVKVREEKKNSIFGDWSEDENEEEEEKDKLKESINNIVEDKYDDSDEDFFSMKTDKQLEAEMKKENKRPAREAKKSPEKSQPSRGKVKGRKKLKKRQSASSAVASLLSSTLAGRAEDSGSEGGEEMAGDWGDLGTSSVDEDMDTGSPPPSPPPTTPSKVS